MSNADRMKALSLKQPWLYAITNLGKRIENRSWLPPNHMLGKRIALHASKASQKSEWRAAEAIHGFPITTAEKIVPRGAVVATAVIFGWAEGVDHSLASEGWWADQEKWFFGPNGWLLRDVRILNEPLPARGMLGLWRVNGVIDAEIRRQLYELGL